MSTVLWSVIIVVVSIVVGTGYKYVFKSAGDDHPVEEIAEDIIKHKTGYDIDLTPASKEGDKKESKVKK